MKLVLPIACQSTVCLGDFHTAFSYVVEQGAGSSRFCAVISCRHLRLSFLSLRLGSPWSCGLGPQHRSLGRFLCHRFARIHAADRAADRSGYHNDGVSCCDVMTDQTLACGPRPFVHVGLVCVPCPLFRAAAALSSITSRAVDLQHVRWY